ncbi:MAG: rRNA maturation RNase YbeY [Candidatus Sulfopaludibacter sp.]|nr:rRNA maturation RNase YbeY [Candidatus Sulfopaludibacter sp.]
MSSPEGSTVTFRRVPASLRRRSIENFARKLEVDVARNRPFDILITGDAELRRLNRNFLGHDYATDVLSFPKAEPSPGQTTLSQGAAFAPRGQSGLSLTELPSLGDLAISLARARAQARQFGHSTEQEIQILMLHGLLHLLGFDHETDNGRMARAEKRWRTRLGLPGGLIERVRK